jgi:hypothetical protein
LLERVAEGVPLHRLLPDRHRAERAGLVAHLLVVLRGHDHERHRPSPVPPSRQDFDGRQIGHHDVRQDDVERPL